jgi:hypothetical protein
MNLYPFEPKQLNIGAIGEKGRKCENLPTIASMQAGSGPAAAKPSA